MQPTEAHNEKMARIQFAGVYPYYLAKVEKKGRTRAELHLVIQWLTGFNEERILQLIQEKVTFQEFFAQAHLNPAAQNIKGLICGYRVEEIQNPLTQKVRYLDKLIDELAKGKKLDKIFRTP